MMTESLQSLDKVAFILNSRFICRIVKCSLLTFLCCGAYVSSSFSCLGIYPVLCSVSVWLPARCARSCRFILPVVPESQNIMQ